MSEKRVETYADFSRMASYLARTVSHWAGDCLMWPNKPVPEDTVKRFCAEIRERLDWIEEQMKPSEDPEPSP